MNISNNYKKHLGYKVKRLREILGVKQEDLAERLNLTQQYVSKIESREDIDDETLKRIARAMKIPSNVIVNFSEDHILRIVANSFSDNSFLENNDIENESDSNKSIEWIVKLHYEKMELYEQMLQSEKEKVALLEELYRQKTGSVSVEY